MAGSLTPEEAHRVAREEGVSAPLYRTVRGVTLPFMRGYFRLHIEGAERIPAEGPAIVAPNHKSFWDAFFVAAATRRHIHFMGKAELFEGRFGRTLVRLGAFPVKRGESDADALETAREILRQGGLLALFPEGTRVRDPETLGSPRRGAARLALETGAPLIPAAITGTEKLFLGPLPKPRRVQIAFGEPIPMGELQPTPENAGQLVEEQLWPEVSAEYKRLRNRPGVIVAGLAAVGLAGAAAEHTRRRRGRKRRRGGLGASAGGLGASAKAAANRGRGTLSCICGSGVPQPLARDCYSSSPVAPQSVATSERAPPRSRCSHR